MNFVSEIANTSFFQSQTLFIKNKIDDVEIKTTHDSVTRSVIDPFLIAQKETSELKESNQNFFDNHWQTIIKQEAERENFTSVKIITPLVETKGENSKYYFKGNYDWILGVCIALVILLVWVRIYFGKVLVQVFRSTVNQQSARKLISEKGSILQKASSILSVIFLISSGFFCFELLSYYHIPIYDFKSISLFLLCIAGFSFFLYMKSFLYWITGFIISAERETIEYISHNNIFYRSVGILLIPIIISLPYVPNNVAQILLYCGIAVFCVSFIMRVIRGFVLSFRVKLSLFYSFLYFCVLEILPVLYVYKIIKMVI